MTYEDFLPYIEKWYTPKITHNIKIQITGFTTKIIVGIWERRKISPFKLTLLFRLYFKIVCISININKNARHNTFQCHEPKWPACRHPDFIRPKNLSNTIIIIGVCMVRTSFPDETARGCSLLSITVLFRARSGSPEGQVKGHDKDTYASMPVVMVIRVVE